ncbi:MAG: hypothetical protein AAGF47_10545, partial [Planctomycetota bacterium]
PNPAIREPVIDPFHHSDSDHGHETGGEQGEMVSSIVRDPSKQQSDAGYAGSLRVLGAVTGVHA